MVMLNAGGANGPKTEDDFGGGKSRPVPGRYHCVISAAEEKASKKKATPGLEVEFEVICDGSTPDGKGTTSGQAGKKIPLFMAYISEKGDDATNTCLERVTRLALCCGVLAPGEEKEVDWEEAIGRELVVEIEDQKYTDQHGQEKSGAAVSFSGFWSLGNKAVVNVPKDATSPGMQALAKRRAADGNGSGAASKEQTTAAAATDAPPKKASRFKDL
jgi:hypothetical protein